MLKQIFSVIILACFLLSGCSGIRSNNGYMPVEDNVMRLKVNITSASSARLKLGEPALILGDRELIYIYASQVTSRVLFLEPKVISRNVLVLYFNKNKKLKKLNRFNLKDGETFALNTDATNINADQKSLFATLFSNVGLGGSRTFD